MSGKRLSVERRAEIAAWYPTKSISELAILFSLSKSSVHNIVEKNNNLGTVADLPRSGRPRISTARDDRCLIRHALRNHFHTSATLKHLWAIQCSRRTIRRRLLSAGLRGCISTMKPPLTVLHRKQRLEWCKLHENWTVDPGYSGNPMFRPAGTTPGHSFELGRLMLQHWELSGKPANSAAL